jgi:hypothetical protein
VVASAPVKTGSKEKMKELHTEGVVTHGDPESCVRACEGAGEALTGAGAGWTCSREKKQFRAPTRLAIAEGNMRDTASARCSGARRGRRTHARTEPYCAGTGRSTVCPRHTGRIGKAEAITR